MKIGFTGATGCVDFGDYAMLVNNINQLVARTSGIEFLVFSYNEANTIQALKSNRVDGCCEVAKDALALMGEDYGNLPNSALNQSDVGCIFEKWKVIFDSCLRGCIPADLQPLADEMASCDILVFNGGGYLNKNWLFRVYSFLVMIVIADEVGVPVVMMPQTYGPFEAKTHADVCSAFKCVKKFYCRDHIFSKDVLLSLGVNESQIEHAIDDLFLLSDGLSHTDVEVCENAFFIQLHRQMREQIPNLIEDMSRCITDLYNADKIKSVVFVLFHHHGDNELGIAREIESRLDRGIQCQVLGPDWNAGKLIDGFAYAKAVLCSRYHPLVISLRKGTPVVNLLAADNTGDYSYYSAKNRGICEYVGAEESQLCIESNKADVVSLAKDMLLDRMNNPFVVSKEKLKEIEGERESVWNSILTFGEK